MVTCTGSYTIEVDEQDLSMLDRITNFANVSAHVRISIKVNQYAVHHCINVPAVAVVVGGGLV